MCGMPLFVDYASNYCDMVTYGTALMFRTDLHALVLATECYRTYSGLFSPGANFPEFH